MANKKVYDSLFKFCDRVVNGLNVILRASTIMLCLVFQNQDKWKYNGPMNAIGGGLLNATSKMHQQQLSQQPQQLMNHQQQQQHHLAHLGGHPMQTQLQQQQQQQQQSLKTMKTIKCQHDFDTTATVFDS